MKRRKSLDEKIRDLARAEDNVVSRGELQRLGMTDHMIRRLVKRMRWTRLQRGVYLTGPGPATWLQQCRAALKAAGPDAVLAGETGLAAAEVDGADQGIIHIQVPHSHRPSLEGVVVSRTTVPDKKRRTKEMWSASIERLLIDFAATAETPRVEEVVESALSKGLTAERRLWRAVATHPHQLAGVSYLTRVLEERPLGKPARSRLEVEFFTLVRRHGLPVPIRNYDTWIDGKHYEIDAAYVDQMGAIECDSRRWHGTASQTRRDRARQDVLEDNGWAFFRVTWRDVLGRPEWVVEQVRTLLAGRFVARNAPQTSRQAG